MLDIYDTPEIRVAIGLPPIHIRYAITETSGRLHVTNTEGKKDALLAEYPGATWYTFRMPAHDENKRSPVPPSCVLF